ncbi:aldo/keto reductase [Sagittula salina]|uniref:Aldo/keto reductase n=1 Tax=Sagittula salina TaxID=2820268 RepID=A0A940MRU7_9RHOB|nr:aldo/keto reductase [Sagittula salina]MBP0483847.1 aldo/keto reductase [Sagittula salina]
MTTLTTLSGDTPARFAFGCMQFGGAADDRAAREMYDACRAAGIRHFDTAYSYTEGESERILGRLIASERDRIFVATKAGYAGGAARANILETFEESRKRLNIDTIDLFYMHRWDGETPLEETFEALAQLQSGGGIRYIGVSNYAAWQVMKAQAVAATFGTRIDVLQPMYNLAKRQAEVEILPMCGSEDILAATYSPLGGGLLTGKYTKDTGTGGRLATDARYAKRYGGDQSHDTARALVDLAAEIGADPATLAVAWVATHPARPIPILSARSEAQLRPSLAAISYPMDEDLRARLSTLGPTPPPATDRLEEA